MSKQTEALKLALEALEEISSHYMSLPKKGCMALAAIEEALAEQPAQEEGCQCPACEVKPHASDCAVHNEPAYQKGLCDCGAQQWNAGVPSLYPEPEPGVSIKAAYEQPAQQQEPVAWIDEFGNVFPLGAQRGPKYLNEPMKPLYTSPPASKPWVGLTDKEIEQVCVPLGAAMLSFTEVARAIEAKLKEKNNG